MPHTLAATEATQQPTLVLERISKSGERSDGAKARSEPRDSTYRYSEGRARKRGLYLGER
jgi:hypothetical protein